MARKPTEATQNCNEQCLVFAYHYCKTMGRVEGQKTGQQIHSEMIDCGVADVEAVLELGESAEASNAPRR